MEDRVDRSELHVQHSDASGGPVLRVSQTAFDLLYHALSVRKGLQKDLRRQWLRKLTNRSNQRTKSI